VSSRLNRSTWQVSIFCAVSIRHRQPCHVRSKNGRGRTWTTSGLKSSFIAILDRFPSLHKLQAGPPLGYPSAVSRGGKPSTTMPRILSRHSGLYRKGPSAYRTGSRQQNQPPHIIDLTTQSLAASNYFAFLNDGLPSSPSATESSRRSQSFSYGLFSQPKIERQSPTTSPRSSFILRYPGVSSQRGPDNDDDETDVWGHHIDPEEAEAEIIRHSKILSRRAVAAFAHQ
jgi:hypothetical protein